MSLLDDCKRKLDILSADSSTDEKLQLCIASGKRHLRKFNPKLTENDFEDNDSLARFLLLNFVLYDYNNVTEAFDDNYRREIIDLRKEYEVSQYEYSEE